MKKKGPNELLLDEWMKRAKKYAKQHHDITLGDDHEFWVTVKTYWNFNVTPETAVKDAIKIFEI